MSFLLLTGVLQSLFYGNIYTNMGLSYIVGINGDFQEKAGLSWSWRMPPVPSWLFCAGSPTARTSLHVQPMASHSPAHASASSCAGPGLCPELSFHVTERRGGGHGKKWQTCFPFSGCCPWRCKRATRPSPETYWSSYGYILQPRVFPLCSFYIWKEGKKRSFSCTKFSTTKIMSWKVTLHLLWFM